MYRGLQQSTSALRPSAADGPTKSTMVINTYPCSVKESTNSAVRNPRSSPEGFYPEQRENLASTDSRMEPNAPVR